MHAESRAELLSSTPPMCMEPGEVLLSNPTSRLFSQVLMSSRQAGWSQLWPPSVRSCRQRQSFGLFAISFLGKQSSRAFSFPPCFLFLGQDAEILMTLPLFQDGD